MSGICGAVSCDGKPMDEESISAMSAVLRTRGPDAGHIWTNGPVGLGHRLLATTPEALEERLVGLEQGGSRKEPCLPPPGQ